VGSGLITPIYWLLLKRVHQSLHSNGHGAKNSKPIIASLPSNEQQKLILLLLHAFRVFYGFNRYCMGETRHIAPSLRLFRPEQPNGVPPAFFF
jgi:hypothetical protein